MPVQNSQLPLSVLMDDISTGELKLPEIQRGYVWKPTQVASLVESLYLGYPTGSLLLWQTDATPRERALQIGERPDTPMARPRFLLDGQQRLTSLHRALRREPSLDPDHFINIVFNVGSQEFQNQSAATKRDPRWVAVAKVVAPDADLLGLAYAAADAFPERDRREMSSRVIRLSQIMHREFHVETLTGFDYPTVADIFVRVNSGGRKLNLTDLALATLSARWPGVVAKLDAESQVWVRESYPDLDSSFLTRLLTSAVLKRGLSAWSHGRLIDAEETSLEAAWALAQTGLRRLVPILKDIGIDQSNMIPSHNALIPLVMMLGSRPGPLSDHDRRGLITYFLASSIMNRYSGSVDTVLSQDIPLALDADDPTRRLLDNLGVADLPQVRADDLRGRTVGSAYFMLSYLACLEADATDWWDRNRLPAARAAGGKLEYHHIHPRATLKDTYEKGQINEIANLAFISARANKRISDRPPADYFRELSETELAAQFVPTGEDLETPEGFPNFLQRRRELLAAGMTAMIGQHAPEWLRPAQPRPAVPVTPVVQFQWYEGPGRTPSMAMTTQVDGQSWNCLLDGTDFRTCLEAAEDGISSDLTVVGESVPVLVGDDEVSVTLGPVRIRGSVDDWQTMLIRELAEGSDDPAPEVSSAPWSGDVVDVSVTETE